jgi:hypothetical protein
MKSRRAVQMRGKVYVTGKKVSSFRNAVTQEVCDIFEYSEHGNILSFRNDGKFILHDMSSHFTFLKRAL